QSSPFSAAAATEKRRQGKKEVAAPAALFSSMPQSQLLQKLWELSKAREKSLPGMSEEQSRHATVNTFSALNDFPAISKFLEEYDKIEQDSRKIPIEELVYDAIWSAVRAKSLGALPPSTLKWIEDSVIRLSEPISEQKESLIWLLSILRDDWSKLLQLQQESTSQKGRVGPEIKREETLRHLALTYLQAGKKEEFRLVFLFHYDEGGMRNAALLHHAMHRSVPKSDPSMLRWYAESLAEYQRVPIKKVPNFTTLMEPIIRLLGGKIEKWAENDRRMERLRKWRGDFNDSELDELTHSLLDFIKYLIVDKKRGTLEDLERLERLLTRLKEKKRKGEETVVIDWLNLCGANHRPVMPIDNLLPSYSLVVVGRERAEGAWAPRSPRESERIKVMEVTAKREKKQELDDVCSLILTVATRGFLLSNDRTKPHIEEFKEYLRV
ncbi:hypothetical protein PMAYCL1PPCAC_22702, partial [Pristionchus mayeri]